jgi:hypothetical protein
MLAANFVTLTRMVDFPITPKHLATDLGVDVKGIRRWLRVQGWRPEVEKGQAWELTVEQAALVRQHFHSLPLPSVAAFDARDWTVGELLLAYASILSELRRRGLVRTNNAPIGDLAEYACAIVYGGTLAPNSAKSFDITAADGKRVQVKVRNVREDTRASSVFSPLRSFDFDVCVFVLVDERNGAVSAAFEWTSTEVREHGTHRSHTNGTVVRVRQVRSGAVGRDVTEHLRAAWATMLALGPEFKG